MKYIGTYMYKSQSQYGYCTSACMVASQLNRQIILLPKHTLTHYWSSFPFNVIIPSKSILHRKLYLDRKLMGSHTNWLVVTMLTVPKSNQLSQSNNCLSRRPIDTSPLFFIFYCFLLHISLLFSEPKHFLHSQWIWGRVDCRLY